MHSSYSTVWRLLIITSVTTFGVGQTSYTSNRMQIGVHITYNHEIQDRFQKDMRDPNYYFTVLLNAVETRLATIPGVTVELTLVGTNVINESDAIEDSEMDKKDILNRFKKYYTSNKFKLGCPDATFYVTMAYFMEQAQDEGSWLYTAKIGGICGNESVGMFYDDGKSFFR
uniref:Putative cysteine-rich secreted protein 93 n=1 Tax=Ixodes ricinus TaxID=34613 RepID=A0A090XAG7_IXORI